MKSFAQKTGGLVIFVLFVLLFAGLPANAASSTVRHHTPADIRAYLKEHNVTEDGSLTYSQQPTVEAPYGLGSLSEETTNSALATLNAIRYIAGLQDNVTISDDYQQLAQGAALVDYVNDKLSHTPVKPADMDQELYDLCYRGAGSTNIAWASWKGRSLNETLIQGWMSDDDASNISVVGHRRWVLNPTMGKTGFGAVDGSKGTYSAMYSFDRSNSSGTETGVMWPAQSMPISYFSEEMPWSISMGQNIDAENIKVTLTRVSDNKIWTFSTAKSDGDFYVDNGNYGQVGCIIFRPKQDSIDGYKDGDTYNVKITGLPDGNLSYSVYFFDAYAETQINLEKTEVTIQEKANANITVSISPKDISMNDLELNVADDTVAGAEMSGNTITITGKKAGTTALTVSVGDTSATCNITVNHVPGAAATCEEPQKCTVCGTILVEATGHNYGEPEFTFSDDYTSAQAKFTCRKCDRFYSVSADITEERTEPTCTKTGKIVYTARVTQNDIEYIATKEVVISATGHDYGEPKFTFSDDYTSAKAEFVCSQCNDKQEVSAEVTENTTEPTCTIDGKIVYTAKVMFEEKIYEDTREKNIAAGHKYGEPQFIFSDDYQSAEAQFICERCDDTKDVSATVTSQSTGASCTEDGMTIYTAITEFQGKKYTEEKKIISEEAKGHRYGSPVFTFSSNYASANAQFICEECDHQENVIAEVTHVGHEASCIEEGNITYTAEVSFEGKQYTAENSVIIPMKDHAWDGGVVTTRPTYTSTGVKTYTCSYCGRKQYEMIPKLEEVHQPFVSPQRPAAPVKNISPMTDIQISGLSNKIAVGKYIQLTVNISPINAANQKLIWSSSNPKLASVDQNGVVTINKKAGGKSVIITATAADGSGTKSTFRIKAMKGVVKKVNIAGAKKRSVKAGKKLKLKARVNATKGANKKLQWTSSNTQYATVSASGKVKTKKAGKGKKVKITAMSTDGSSKKETVTIKIK